MVKDTLISSVVTPGHVFQHNENSYLFLRIFFFFTPSSRAQGKNWSNEPVVLLGLLILLPLEDTFEIYRLLINFFSHFLYFMWELLFALKKHFIVHKFLLSWNIVTRYTKRERKKKRQWKVKNVSLSLEIQDQPEFN